MSRKIVKNISETDQVLVGYGLVKPEATVEVDENFFNANFEEVIEKAKTKSEERRINETLKGK